MIRINECYTIDADKYCYVLYYDDGSVKIGKDGKERKDRDVLGYYGSLQNALTAIFDFKLKEITGEGEKSLCDALTEARTAFSELIGQVKAAVPDVEVTVR